MSKGLNTKVNPLTANSKNQQARKGRQNISPKANFSNMNKQRKILIDMQQCSQLTNKMVGIKSKL